jgi:hypothetical protein
MVRLFKELEATWFLAGRGTEERSIHHDVIGLGPQL